MTNFIKRWTASPKFDDKGKTQLARSLNIILLAMILITALYAAFSSMIYDDPSKILISVAIIIPLWIGAVWLMHRGNVVLAGTIFLLGLLFIVTYVAAVSGGVHATATCTYITIILAAGLVFGTKIGFVFAGLSTLSGLGLLLAELNGLLPTPILHPNPVTDWIGLTVNFALSAVLLYLTTNSITTALARARRDELALAESNQQLKAEIDKRAATEEALRSSEAHFRTIFNGLNEALFIHDLTGAIIDVNDKMCEMYGYTREQALQLDIEALSSGTSPYTEQEALSWMKRAGEQGPQVFEWLARDSKDRLFWIEVNMRRAMIGGEIRNLVTVRDISQRKQAEEEIQRLNEILAQRVIERTQQFEAAYQGLEEFAYSISHDLRTPLRSIDGFSQALLEDYGERLDVQGRDYLRRVRVASQHMAQLIDDLLKLSHITRWEMHPEATDLSAIAQTFVESLQRSEPNRYVTINIEPDVVVWGDPYLLRTMLENLLDNAWKFTRKSEDSQITFRKTETAEKLIYTVQDNGVGFDMAHAGMLFSPFQRLHRADEFEGNGIGLAIVERIVKRHSGEVWAQATVEHGATFYFTLPEDRIT